MLSPEPSISKILMTADAVGGVWTYALDLCRAYRVMGIKVVLATMGAPLSAAQRQDAVNIGSIELFESDFKLEWMDNPWDDIARAGAWLLDIEAQTSPDVIHLNGYAHAALNWNAPVVVVAHSCVLSWWQAVKKEQAPAAWNWYKETVKRGLEKAGAIVAISHSYACDLHYLYNIHRDIDVIYNGADAGCFYSANKKKQAFAMGRIWDEAKNLSLIGRIKNTAQLPVLIAGNNYHPGGGPATEIPNVTLLGLLTYQQVREQLAQSYIYILPAKYEPFGLSVLEAALSGCVLLLADIPTLRELWQDAAFYFDPERPEALDALLNYVLDHPEDCTAHIRRASERAKLFSLETMAQNYVELYQSLMHRRLLTV